VSGVQVYVEHSGVETPLPLLQQRATMVVFPWDLKDGQLRSLLRCVLMFPWNFSKVREKFSFLRQVALFIGHCPW
jgi:hypothetical protein